jgi:hypothetical protein
VAKIFGHRFSRKRRRAMNLHLIITAATIAKGDCKSINTLGRLE